MNKELLKRIFTSLLILPIVIYCVFSAGIYLIVLLLFIFILTFYEIIKNTKNLFFIFFSNIVIISSLLSFYYLRGETNYSLTIVLWILILTFLSDIGGYIFGNILKGRKLTKISPNKTYSGAIGSLILSSLSLPSMSIVQNLFFDELLINFMQVNFFLITILLSIICQLGDLYVSFWKRKINIKNISNILPGHGGLLDRIDGLIFVLISSSILIFFFDII
jgi:phosphatidate cytidylyltransferase